MIINVAICDDEPNDVNNIKSFLNRYEMENNIDFSIQLYVDGTKLLENYQKGYYHLIFLDVEMPNINGLDVARYIRQNINDYNTRIVFVSNYPEYMQDSFNVQAFNYFPKPFRYDNFIMLINQLLHSIETSTCTRLLIRDDSSEELVNINDILMISTEDSKNKRIKITFSDRELIINGLLSEWSDELYDLGFATPARGFLVNMRHIHYIMDNSLILDNGMSIPLSRRNNKEIRKLFNRRLLTLEGNR